jgi:uncharacterized protein (TIGR02246 family)
MEVGMNARFPIVLLAAVIGVACAAEPDQQEAQGAAEVAEPSADEAALEQLRADYVTHYNQHHAAIVADMFTDSAFGLWADGTVTMGKPAFLADLEQEMASAPTLGLQTGDVMVFGDYAVSRGTYDVTFTPPGATAITLAGSYLTHFEKSADAWKINGVITNLNAPPPEGLPAADTAETEPPPEDGTMKELGAQWSRHYAAGDWAALAAMYTEDAVVAFTEAPALEGRAAIQARFTERSGALTERQIQIHDVGTLDLGGGWALDGGWYTVTATSPEGPMTQEGTYMHLLRQQPDGTWKIHWAVSNGHMTPAGERG